jgi:hypothetical protein
MGTIVPYRSKQPQRAAESAREASIALELRNAGLDFELVGDRLLRLCDEHGRAIYVSEYDGGDWGRRRWVVYIDGIGREPATQHPCASVGAALLVVRASLIGLPLPSGLPVG